MGGFDNGTTSVELGTNSFGGFGALEEFSQKTGILAVRYGLWSLLYENNGVPFDDLKLGDGKDSYRTAALELGYGDWAIGFKLFTGFRGTGTFQNKLNESSLNNPLIKKGNFNEWMPNGFVDEEGTPYRMGALYVSYQRIEFGIDSDRHIRHPIQDIFAHHVLKKQLGFRSYNNSIDPYYKIRSESSVRKRFSIYGD